MQTYYSEKQAAAVLGDVSFRTLQKWRVTGGGPVFTKIGARVLYAEADLIEFLESRKRKSTSDRGE